MLALLILLGFASGKNTNPFIWPLPSSYDVSESLSVSLNNSFKITTTSSSNLIQKAIERYNNIIFAHTPQKQPTSCINSIDITIKDDTDTNLNFGIDESYTLIFPGSGIRSNTVWGALKALETFSQIVIFNFTNKYYQSYKVNITDSPRFKWRGLLIDTGRHYLSINTLKTLIDSMSYAKFNTLHWHLTDTQSFPYESKAAPKLWNAAFNEYQIYTQMDIKSLIQYAMDRGVRIVVEFDMPGHSASWCVGYPEICPNPACNLPVNGSDKPDGILNPASNMTYNIISDLLTEASNIFIDDYIHIGGDETSTSCWDQTPAIKQWEQENNFTDNTALLYLIEYAQNVIHSVNKKAINWVDVFSEYASKLNKNLTTIQVWKSQSTLKQVVAAGFNAILSSNVEWYINYVYAESGYNSWQTMYNAEPYEGITNIEQQQLILGGEGALWGEYIDSSNVENSMWPRAAAIGERLWSPRYVNDTSVAQPRYAYFRCLLNQRGIAAEPYNYSQPGMPPPHPGSCYDQR